MADVLTTDSAFFSFFCLSLLCTMLHATSHNTVNLVDINRSEAASRSYTVIPLTDGNKRSIVGNRGTPTRYERPLFTRRPQTLCDTDK